jgi:hypothetical protein
MEESLDSKTKPFPGTTSEHSEANHFQFHKLRWPVHFGHALEPEVEFTPFAVS